MSTGSRVFPDPSLVRCFTVRYRSGRSAALGPSTPNGVQARFQSDPSDVDACSLVLRPQPTLLPIPVYLGVKEDNKRVCLTLRILNWGKILLCTGTIREFRHRSC